MERVLNLPTRTWKGLRLFTIPDNKFAVWIWDPALYVTITCRGSPRLAIKLRRGPDTTPEDMMILMTAYPTLIEGQSPRPRGAAMHCPIVLRCNCKRSRCIGNTAQSVHAPPALDQMDFPGIRIVVWRELLESWDVHREEVWQIYDLPPIFALDMTGVMDPG